MATAAAAMAPSATHLPREAWAGARSRRGRRPRPSRSARRRPTGSSIRRAKPPAVASKPATACGVGIASTAQARRRGLARHGDGERLGHLLRRREARLRLARARAREPVRRRPAASDGLDPGAARGAGRGGSSARARPRSPRRTACRPVSASNATTPRDQRSRPEVDRLRADDLLGAHVERRADERARARRAADDADAARTLRDAEVEELDEELPSPGVAEEDVARLDVAVDDAALVRLAERPRELRDDGDDLARLEGAAARGAAARGRAPRAAPSRCTARRSSSTPWSNICTTCGLFTCDAAAASREKRASASGLLARSRAMNFTTTCVRSDWCSATQTAPMPPSPRGRRSRTFDVTIMPALGSDTAANPLDAGACA